MQMLKAIFQIFKQTITEFSDDRVMKMSASLTYYALFSLSPIILIVISLASLFYKKEAIENRLYYEIKEWVGSDLALQIQNFVANSTISGDSNFILYLGVGVLVFGATTMLTDMQDSLNLIWHVEAVPKKAFLKFLANRGVSFLFIMAMGILLFSSVLVSSVMMRFGEDLFALFELDKTISASTFLVINNIFSYLLSVIVFFLLFKFLPDIKVKAKPIWVGAFVTGAFFFFAKYFIHYYLSISKYNTIFGSAGSVVILILYIYYNATIMYFGAKFTKVYAEYYHFEIRPTKLAKRRKVTHEDNEVE
ncbi:YihY/virulence factor BrkB family protein [Vaginella massiliensis]|uniref:YihY/virulence factor BrkB family protein n=1 Tax=Vaginella massiliensis TaxID=1816680 RepID=UPI0037528C72